MVFRRVFGVMKGSLYALLFNLSEGLCVGINSFGSIHPYQYCLLQSPSLFLRLLFVFAAFVCLWRGREKDDLLVVNSFGSINKYHYCLLQFPFSAAFIRWYCFCFFRGGEGQGEGKERKRGWVRY